MMHRGLGGMLEDWIALCQVGLLLVRVGRQWVRLPCLCASTLGLMSVTGRHAVKYVCSTTLAYQPQCLLYLIGVRTSLLVVRWLAQVMLLVLLVSGLHGVWEVRHGLSSIWRCRRSGRTAKHIQNSPSVLTSPWKGGVPLVGLATIPVSLTMVHKRLLCILVLRPTAEITRPVVHRLDKTTPLGDAAKNSLFLEVLRCQPFLPFCTMQSKPLLVLWDEEPSHRNTLQHPWLLGASRST